DQAAARWAWQHGEPAGADTGTLPNAHFTFRPLQGLKARSGVAGFDARTLEGEAGERFVSALLNPVSHDLRTPLSTVLGSATTLLEYGKSLDRKVQVDLLSSIREEAER